jgi:GMP synthase-like glutamine amidotransferase
MDVVEQALAKSRNAGRDAILMRMAVLQHIGFEGPAAIAEWAAMRGVSRAVFHLYQGEPLPALASFDMLTVMGGPMSANDEALFPWLGPEIALVREAIGAGKIVLGVCLGAQIAAKALGARVYAAQQKEIGWFPVRRTEAAHPVFEGVPERFTPFHWHGETFDIPAGAARLAETPSTPNQAFAFGRHVLGLQFHLEANAESVSALVSNCGAEIGGGPFEEQTPAILGGVHRCEDLQPILTCVMDSLTAAASEGK